MLRQRLAVPPEKLCQECLSTVFPFASTAEIEPLQGLIGQERAVAALDFGLGVRHHGYHIFVAGEPGTGKSSYTRSLVAARARGEKRAYDWCYAFNFQQPDSPLALRLPAGEGAGFARDMDELIRDLRLAIGRAFSTAEYDRERTALVRQTQEEIAQVVGAAEQFAQEAGFVLRATPAGFAALPTMLGRPLTPEDFEALDPAARRRIEERSTEVQMRVRDALRRVWALEKEAQGRLRDLDRKVAEVAIDPAIARLQEKYRAVERVHDFLEQVQKDILDRLEWFRNPDVLEEPAPPAEEEVAAAGGGGEVGRGRRPARRAAVDPFRRYRVNVVVNQAGVEGAPVVVESNPTFYNLFGKVEYTGQLGDLGTDHMMIRAGAVHRANGGYLILHAADVLQSPGAWDALKRTLTNREVRIESFGEQYRLINTPTLRPEPIPLDVKVVLIGSPFVHQVLYQFDEAFRKLFKIKADFETDMPRTAENLQNYARFISSICSRDGLLAFEPAAVARVIEYSSRIAHDQRKLSTRFNEVTELIYEADAWAAREGAKKVTAALVDRAIREKIARSNQIEDRIQEMLLRGHLMVATEGAVVGQVNGLSVYDVGDYAFGRPSRITARVFMGQRGVVNIEREAEMSGKIHSKGVLILSAYLGAKYAQDKPLSLSASLTFEQLYSGVEGDSASSAELYALLSALSGLPIDQQIAVTGSVNQHGEIQPVGGVIHKIEGFFDLCRARGLTGRQGVIIPHQNVENLMLRADVVAAVREGKFHVWAVHTVDEGIELLTGVPAGRREPGGAYPPGTVHDLVNRKLEQFARDLAAFARPPATEAKAG